MALYPKKKRKKNKMKKEESQISFVLHRKGDFSQERNFENFSENILALAIFFTTCIEWRKTSSINSETTKET
jgi:hypothetical protein